MRSHVQRTTRIAVRGLVAAMMVGAIESPAGASTRLSPAAMQVSVSEHLAGCDPVGTSLNGSTAQVLSLVLPSAYTSTPNGTVSQADSILDQAEVVGLNPLTVDYQIKPSAIWSDGTPIGLSDFLATWRVGAAGSGAGVAQYRNIRTIKQGLNPHQIVVTFSHPSSSWQALFSPLLPRSTTPSQLKKCTLPSALVDKSGGPFEIVGSSSSSVILAKNPRWWGPTPLVSLLQVNGGVASADGASSVIPALAERTWFSSAELAGLTSLPSSNSTVTVSNSILSLNFNVRDGLTRSVWVRRAIVRMIDRQRIVMATATSVDPSAAVAGSSLLSQGQPGYSGPAPPESSSPTTTSTTSTTSISAPQPSTPAIPSTHPAHQPASSSRQTAALLAHAGFHAANGSWVSKGGRVLALTLAVPVDDGWALQSAPLLADQLRTSGVRLRLLYVTSSEAASASLLGAHSAMSLIARPTDPFIDHAVAWFSRSHGIPASPLWSGFTSKTVASLARRAATDMNPETARPLYTAIDDVLAAHVPTLPLFTEPVATVWSSSISGVVANPYPPGTLGSLLTWQPSATSSSSSR